MPKKDKLVRGIDDTTWTKFTGYCFGNRIKVGDQLTEIIKSFLKRKNVK